MRYIDHIRNMSDDQLAYFLNALQCRLVREEMSKRAELKPCPFCGHEAVIDDCGDHRYFVRCTHCSINQDKLYAQRCDAIRAWNRRVNIENILAAQQWIPVTERLPDIERHYISKPCLCYCSNGVYCFGKLEQNIFGQVGWNCEKDDDYYQPAGEVVAWMPLPVPYEEANE